ncbi:hypothetical protein [Zoogloea sp.]|uniref:hypothetical protein n=1 Tax=Zoogloea sp. TaxID=49181 RepID=UPI0025EF3819|nr:hypothetical protein [Zoogloea sp.]MCK6395799.1 hypothetical protein [Zoogloea sp.]
MNDVVDIGQLSTRIRSADAEHAQALAGQVRQLADRHLARAMEGTGSRALARAHLPAGAVVAVQRLDLQLKVAADVPVHELAAGWAAAFEAGLVRLLATIPPGDVDDDAPAVWFADPWAAEQRHLERRLAGMADAWWAPDLAGDDDTSAASNALAPLDAFSILQRWLRRDPARTVSTLAGMARADARASTLLTPGEAASFTRMLLQQLAAPDAAGPQGTAAAPDGPGSREPRTTLQSAPSAADMLPAHLQAAFARLGRHHQRLVTHAASSKAVAPWLVALLLAEAPSLSKLPAAMLAGLLERVTTARPDPAPVAPSAAPPAAASQSTTGPAEALPNATAQHAVNAGGLLLLLRPLVRLGLLPAPEHLGTALGDLALCALRRAFAPLPPGERAVAEERERPLLSVFAPECDWRTPIALIPLHDPAAAHALLDALVAAIPADIAAAPGALRQVFGPLPPAFPTQADTHLARLLLRPGLLGVTPWDAELSWPLASIDLALRRAGWDQDPGWLPWLGRSVRLRFGDPS